MRKLLFTIILLFATLSMNAENFIYCELVGTGRMLSNKVKVQVDYGQETSFWKGISYMKDENGKNVEFNSMVDAMNYFGKQGWDRSGVYRYNRKPERVSLASEKGSNGRRTR